MIALIFSFWLGSPASAAIQPSSLENYHGWYRYADSTSERIVYVGPFGLGVLNKISPDGRPWAVLQRWDAVTRVAPRRFDFGVRLNSRMGEMLLRRIPFTAKASLSLNNLTYVRQPEGTARTFSGRRTVPEPSAQDLRDARTEVLNQIYDLYGPAPVTIAQLRRAQRTAKLAQYRFDAHNKLLLIYGTGDVNQIYRQNFGLVPTDVWPLIKMFEYPQYGYQDYERFDQLRLMNAIARYATDESLPYMFRTAAGEVPRLPYTRASELLREHDCIKALSLQSAARDLEHDRNVQVQAVAP